MVRIRYVPVSGERSKPVTARSFEKLFEELVARRAVWISRACADRCFDLSISSVIEMRATIRRCGDVAAHAMQRERR